MIAALALVVLVGFSAHAAEIPIEARPGERVILKVEAKRKDGTYRTLRMILDTGAKSCVVDAASASDIVTGMFKLLEATGFSGRGRRALQRTLRELRVGEASQTSVPALVMDLSERNKWQDEPVDGLLGMSFLEGRRFLVDPHRACLVWNGSFAPSRSIPLKAHQNYFYLPVFVAGNKVEALMDTAASGTLYVGHLPRGLAFLADCEMGSGIDGFVRLGKTRADLKVFGENFARRPIWIGGSEAVLGASFLLAGPTQFDLKEHVIQVPMDAQGKLMRAPSVPDEVAFPICWNRKGRLPFLEVAPMPTCHRWYLAGFRAGDRVLNVGNASDLTLARINSLIRDGQAFDWSLQRGKQALVVKNPREDRRRDRLEEAESFSLPFPPATGATPSVH